MGKIGEASLTLDGAIRYANLIEEEISKAQIKINGEFKEKLFYKKKVEGNCITILLYLEDLDVGIIEEVKLLAEDGTILHNKADIIKKDNTEGFIVGFKFYITGKEVM